MAHDKSKQIEIRAYYESHNLSYVKVAEHFVSTGYEVSSKTIEGWGSKGKWVKKRYSSLSDALDDLIDDKVIDLIQEDAKDLVKKKIELNNDELEPDVIEAMADTISTELTYQILNKKALAKEMALNLGNAKKFAVASRSISTNAVYHDMLMKTFAMLNGKDEKMPLPNPDAEIKLEKPLSDMTLDDLNALGDEHE